MARTTGTKLTSTLAALAIASLLCCDSPALATVIVFGSDNDGYGGFTAEVSTIVATPAPAWTLETDAARMTNAPTADSGQVNSSLLREYTLDRTPGSSYTITGVLDWVSTYAADNNRAGIMLFATSGNLAGADSGLSLQYNIGSGAFRIAGGGVNGSDLATASYGVVAERADRIGTVFTYIADIAFVGTDIEVDFTLNNGVTSQSLSTTVAAAT